MKKGVIGILFLLLVVGISFASSAGRHYATNLSIIVDGSSRNLQDAATYFIGTHTYVSSPSTSLPVGSHNLSQIWVLVQDGEMNLFDALKSRHKLCPARTIRNYTGIVPSPGHYASEIVLEGGIALQTAINEGALCGCSPGDTLTYNGTGWDGMCTVYNTTVACTAAGVWAQQAVRYQVQRGTICGLYIPGCKGIRAGINSTTCLDLTKACDGSGNCVGYSGTGCASFPTGTVAGSGITCGRLSGSNISYIGKSSSGGGSWSLDNYYVRCSYNCNCKISQGCDTCSDSWNLRPALPSASVINTCTAPSSGGGGGETPDPTPPAPEIPEVSDPIPTPPPSTEPEIPLPLPEPPAEEPPEPETGCFIEGTLVSTLTGMKDIATLEVGDYVLSYSTEGKYFELSRIGKVLVHEQNTNWYYVIKTEHSQVEVTDVHPFYVGNNRYQKAEDLVIGDLIYVEVDGKLIQEKILSKERVNLNEYITVYNLELEEKSPKNYFANGYLVHNGNSYLGITGNYQVK